VAQITIHHIDGSTNLIIASPAISLLNNLLSAGIFLHHRCGGKAECGTCRVRIIAANQEKQVANTISPKEAHRLAATHARPEEGDRLACQTYIYRDCDVYLFG